MLELVRPVVFGHVKTLRIWMTKCCDCCCLEEGGEEREEASTLDSMVPLQMTREDAAASRL